MSISIYVPRDSAALAVGADRVAKAVAAQAQNRQIDVRLVRNSSRGMFWLEPLLEISTPEGRVAFGPVEPEDIVDIFDQGLGQATQHPLYLLSLIHISEPTRPY